MDQLSKFCAEIKSILNDDNNLTIQEARKVVKHINDFLYTNYSDIGSTYVLGGEREYFSDFHKFWEKHHKEILDCKIDDKKCELVADALHDVFIKTNGEAFKESYDTYGLAKDEICRIRLLTANQDFNGSLEFGQMAKIYKTDNSIFDEKLIHLEPSHFINEIKLSNKSQNDKRNKYAQNISKFLIEKKCSPYELIEFYNRDVFQLRMDLISYYSAGYGNKKADMFIRDMVVLGVWNNVKGFDKIDVASDVNTIKVALRTGIIKSQIPLVSSFLDIFCYQYEYIDSMNAKAWRKVWEIWNKKYPMECLESPCLIDYFIYNVVGKQFCKEILYYFSCEKHGHIFKWHSPLNKTCQICYKNGVKERVPAILIDKRMPCADEDGSIAILHTKYVSELPMDKKMKECPFKYICGNKRTLQPPKSISILGRTGWTTAYTRKGNGGGGLMS